MRIVSRCLFAVMFLALPLYASTAGPTTIAISPAVPHLGDLITVTIRGVWPELCTPRDPIVSFVGHTIRVEATSICGPCAAVVTNYTLSTTVQAPADVSSAGDYTIEYFAGCSQGRVLDATQRFMLAAGGCDFSKSLTISRSSPTEAFTFNWCNPSWAASSDSFAVRYYRIYQSRSANGPFTPVGELAGQTATQIRFAANSFGEGVMYFYVEAHGCLNDACERLGRETIIPSNVVAVTLEPQSLCGQNSTTLCLGGNRFQVTAQWRTPDGQSGDAFAIPLTNDSGYFWFFQPDNIELSVKVLNACSAPIPAFWVFSAGLTNVQVDLTVTDTKTNTVRRYSNPQGRDFAPIFDTSAFSTCP